MRKLWGWLVVGILIGLGFGGITAQATDTAVTTTLPPSMAITGIFNTTSSIANVTNTATLVANNHGLQITEGNNHAGSAWATNNYKVDLSKDATFSLWLYLGKGGAGSAGQGMTFVLQNAGTTGFTTTPAGRMAGQSLGTWGLDFNSTAPDATTVAAAIPKVGRWSLMSRSMIVVMVAIIMGLITTISIPRPSTLRLITPRRRLPTAEMGRRPVGPNTFIF